MTTPTATLRQEHRRLRPRLEAIRTLADRLDIAATSDAMQQLDDTVAFLTRVLLPHALAEDEVLYPAVAVAMGAEHATDTMSRDHLEIARLVQQLDHLRRRFRVQPARTLRRDIRRVLYEIEGIAQLHLDKEEEIYLPLLDSYLSDEAAVGLFAAMHDAAQRAKVRWAS